MGKDDSTREMYLTLSLPGSAPGVILKQYARSQGELSLGRAAKSDSSAAALDTPKFRSDKTRVMSNKHAKLAWNGNTPTITDVGSTNGVRIRQVDDPTSLYECKVGVAYRINSGDTIVFGKPVQDPDQSGEVMCQPLEVVANVTPTPTVPPAKTKPTQGNRPDSAPLERVLTIGYARRGPLIHSVAKEPTEQPQTQPERFTPRLNLKAPSGQPQTQPELRRGPLKLPSMGCVERTTEQQQELKPDRPLPPLASLADSAPDHPKPHSRSTGFGLTDTDVCVSLANTDDEAERKPAFVGISRDGKDEMLPVSDNVEPLAKPIKSSSPESFSLPEKGAEQQAVVDGDDTEIPIKTSQEDKPDVAEVENAPLTAFQRIVIEGLERRTPPPGPLDPSSPPQLDDAPAAVEVARKVTVLEVASQASHLPSPVSSDHEAEAPEQEKPLDHGVEPKQANASENDEDLLGRLLDDAALLPLEKGDQSISDKVGRHVDHEVAAGQAEAELLLSPVPEPVVAAELVFSPPSVFPAEQNQVEPDVQAEDIDLAPVPVSTQDEKDRLVSRWRVGLDQAVGEGDGPSQERLQEDNNVRPLDATQEEKDKLIARWHAELAQAAEGDPDQLDGGALDDLAMAFDLEHDNTGVVEDSQCARSDQGPEIVEDSAFMDEEAHDNAEAAGEAELPVEALPVGEATKDRSSSPAEEALSEDEELGAGPSAHDSEAEVEDEVEADEDDEVELDEQDDVEAEVDEEDDAEADVDSEAGVEHEVEEDDEDQDEFEAGAEVEDACEVDEEEEFEVDGQEHFEVDAEGDFFDDSSYSEHDQQDGDDEQQPFEEARALLDVIDRKEPRVAAALLNIMKDLAENKIDLDARYDEANASNARATASRVDGDDEEQEEADVDEINSACSGSSDRVDQALEDREEDLQEETGGQSSYDDGGDSAGDDHDAEEGFRVHVQGLPEDANSESDASELDPETPTPLRHKRRFSEVDSDGLTDWLERENNGAAAQESDASNENNVENLAPADQGNPKRRCLSFPFKSFTIGVLTGLVGAVAGLTACDAFLGPS